LSCGEKTRYRIPLLDSPKVLGCLSSRGSRPDQQDRAQAVALELPLKELRDERGLECGLQGDDNGLTQVGYFSVFDGHGGSKASDYLRKTLHQTVENVKETDAQEVVTYLKGLGGYFKRYNGGPLQPLLDSKGKNGLDLKTRLHLAFLASDKAILKQDIKDGACATTALICTMDGLPFFESSKILLNLAHVGDTRAVLCYSSDGRAQALTEKHHPDSRGEAERLRRSGGAMVTDSFGENRWMGVLACTRSFGDAKYKKLGVTAEPETSVRSFSGDDVAFLAIFTDGIGDVMSDQELCDIISRPSPRDRSRWSPTTAAHAVVDYADDLGSEDNETIMVIPFKNFRKVRGEDKTGELRAYKTEEGQDQQSRSRRM